MKHINVYEVDRAYGGPEEGGWWYDTGTFRPDLSVAAPDVAAVAVADAIENRLRDQADEASVPPVGYTMYRGGRYTVRVEDAPGVDYPAVTPVYS
jgi:hypothetical protein